MGIVAGNVSEYKKYTGLAKMEVVAINPTLQELKDLGVNMQNEPVYKSTMDDGTSVMRLDFWLKHENPDILVPVKFFIQDKLATSMGGKKQYINKLGMSTYGDSIELIKNQVPDWFETDTLRQAYVGESLLIDFMRSWICVPKNKEATIDNWNNLFQGNVTELRSYMDMSPSPDKGKYKVQVMLYVNEGGWQTVYNKFTARMDNSNVDKWRKHFERTQNAINFGGDFTLKEFTGVPTPSNYDSPSQEGSWGD